jgi:AAA15 family ATPase/GTPase
VVLTTIVILVETTDSYITIIVNSPVQLTQLVCMVMSKLENVTIVLMIVDIVSNHVTLTTLNVKLSVNNVKNQNILLLKMITVSQLAQKPTITLNLQSKLVNLVSPHV